MWSTLSITKYFSYILGNLSPLSHSSLHALSGGCWRGERDDSVCARNDEAKREGKDKTSKSSTAKCLGLASKNMFDISLGGKWNKQYVEGEASHLKTSPANQFEVGTFSRRKKLITDGTAPYRKMKPRELPPATDRGQRPKDRGHDTRSSTYCTKAQHPSQ